MDTWLVRPDDFFRCKGGDDEACQRIAFWLYVFPKIRRELEKLKLVPERVPFPPIPRPDPPPPPWIQEILPMLLGPAFGEPNPEPSLVDARRGALEKTLGALDSLKSTLKNDIERLTNV